MASKLFVNLYIQRNERYAWNLIEIGCYIRKASNTSRAVSSIRLKQLFKQHSLSSMDGHACFIGDCPICINKTKGPKIYINKRTGLFICDKCRFTGSWDLVEKCLSITTSKERNETLYSLKANLKMEESFLDKWQETKHNCKSVLDLSPEMYENILNTFSLPHIPQDTMSRLNCFYEPSSGMMHFPLTGLGNCIVGYKSLKAIPDMEETVPNIDGSGCVVYRQQDVKNDMTAVVVGTMHDLLALVSQNSANVIICLPYNVQKLPQQLLPGLERFKQLILWFENNESSWHMAKQFARKLGEKRCSFVIPTDLQPRPKIAAKLGFDLEGILRNARSMWHESIITFQHLREDILSDLQNTDKVQGIKWKRYPSLNRILKGHRRGEFTVLTGPTGCGKTTFMSEYSLDLAMQGVNTLWGSFEIRNVRLAKTMLQQMAEVPLEENIENFHSYADAFEKLPIYFMTFHGQQSIKVVMDAVEHAAYIHDIAHVVIDNIQFMMGISDHHADRFWKQDNVISKFRNFATKCNCHVTIVMHPRKERAEEELTASSIFGSAKASQEADNILIIQDKRVNNIKGKKYLQIAKNRYSGDLGLMVLDFDKTALSYATKKKPKAPTTAERTTNTTNLRSNAEKF